MSYPRSRSEWPHSGDPSTSSSSHHHNHPLSLPVPQLRYPGHGYDFRRPIMSSATPSRSEDVVDLTNEPDSPPLRSRRSNRPAHRHRPPRFGRNIMADVIDLEEEEDEDDGEDGQTEVINLDPPSSPEVQFVRETARPARRPPMFPAPSHLLDVINFHAQQGFLSTQEAFRQEIALQTRRMGRYPSTRPNMDEIFISSDGNRNIDVPIDLDYQAPGFTIHESQPTPPPSYKPPSPPPEGFTRTVSEDDVVVCPNCDRELGIGDGPRQQIWVAKQCGHVCFLCKFAKQIDFPVS